MKLRNLLAVLALIFVCQGAFAQSYNDGSVNRDLWLDALAKAFYDSSRAYYDSDVNQYCDRVNSHPSSCWGESSIQCSVYGGLMMSLINDDKYFGNKSLVGLDAGFKCSFLSGRSCTTTQFELNGYIDARIAKYYSREDGDSFRDTGYAIQFSIAPGIRFNRFSIDCGPYVGYAGYEPWVVEEVHFEDKNPSPNVSGFDYGFRVGCALHFERIELGLHCDIDFSGHNGRYKKNDFMLSIGYKFKPIRL